MAVLPRSRLTPSRTSLLILLALILCYLLASRPFSNPLPRRTFQRRRDPPVLGCPAENASQDSWMTSHKRGEKAAILLLARDGDLEALLPTLANFEDKFNAKFRYPYVFLNEDTLSRDFQAGIRKALPANAVVEFGTIPKEHWSIPDWLDKEQVRRGFGKMKEEGIQYADRESYHHMCRYYSGLFALHPLMLKYNYYWRLEPGGACHLLYDLSVADLYASPLLLRAAVRPFPVHGSARQSLRLGDQHRRNPKYHSYALQHYSRLAK